MRLRLDEYAHLDSPLHRWEPRCRLVGLLALVFAFGSVQDLRLLPAMLVVAAVLYVISRLPFSFLVARLRAPGVFLLSVAILLPFFSGPTALLRVGPLVLRKEGSLAMLLVVAKFVSILTTSLVLFGTAPFLSTLKAMRSLGIPAILADMTLLSYRYLFEIGDDLEKMQTAVRLRGFRGRRPDRRTLGVLASLAGSILVRSYERSDRVYKAMVLRGYGHSPLMRDEFQTRPQDLGIFAGILIVAGGFVTAEVLLRGLSG